MIDCCKNRRRPDSLRHRQRPRDPLLRDGCTSVRVLLASLLPYRLRIFLRAEAFPVLMEHDTVIARDYVAACGHAFFRKDDHFDSPDCCNC